MSDLKSEPLKDETCFEIHGKGDIYNYSKKRQCEVCGRAIEIVELSLDGLFYHPMCAYEVRLWKQPEGKWWQFWK